MILYLLACTGVKDLDPADEGELITTVELVLTDASGTEAVYAWADPELDGAPEIDALVLAEGSYDVEVFFLNEAEEPAEDITVEVADESDQHQVFYTDADGLLDYVYEDEDANGDPVGLVGTVTTLGLGEGEWTVTLRHLPPQNDQAVKAPGLAEVVAESGLAAIGGDTDASVTFPVTVE